jgi:tetratricopeptide (TPR) repeat protein
MLLLELGQHRTRETVNDAGYIDNGDLAQARHQFQRALQIWREIGERWAMTNTLHNLANVAREEGDIHEAQRLYHESIIGWQAMNDNWGIAYWLEDTAVFRLRQGEPAQALQLMSVAEDLRESIGAPRPPSHLEKLNELLAPAFASLTEAEQKESAAAGRTLSLDQAISMAIDGL